MSAITERYNPKSTINLVPHSNVEVEPKCDVNLKVDSFMKEIETIQDSEKNLKKSSDLWQECCDYNTGYIYYWNTKTNEVTWQAPEEISQTYSTNKEDNFPNAANVHSNLTEDCKLKSFRTENGSSVNVDDIIKEIENELPPDYQKSINSHNSNNTYSNLNSTGISLLAIYEDDQDTEDEEENDVKVVDSIKSEIVKEHETENNKIGKEINEGNQLLHPSDRRQDDRLYTYTNINSNHEANLFLPDTIDHSSTFVKDLIPQECSDAENINFTDVYFDHNDKVMPLSSDNSESLTDENVLTSKIQNLLEELSNKLIYLQSNSDNATVEKLFIEVKVLAKAWYSRALKSQYILKFLESMFNQIMSCEDKIH